MSYTKRTEDLIRKYPTLDPDWIRAIVKLQNDNVNERFLTCDSPMNIGSGLWSRIKKYFKNE